MCVARLSLYIYNYLHIYVLLRANINIVEMYDQLFRLLVVYLRALNENKRIIGM
jgi:hypothetical protein